MRLTRTVLLSVVLLLSCLLAPPANAAGTGGVNDPGCVPAAAHPDPVIVLHGLGATYYEDLNVFQDYLASRGYCTFSETYGDFPGFAYVGGLRHVADSAAEIKDQIQRVLAETGAAKVDIVGHSEGGFQSLYVTKTQGIADRIDSVVAIAPPTHGTSFGGLVKLAYLFGVRSQVAQVLQTFGCPACDDLITDGAAVKVLTTGPIAQPGVRYTVITSQYDELVTPTSTSFVDEPGVKNAYVQDLCPFDPVGHLNEAYDYNVWRMAENALDPAHATTFACLAGFAG